MIPSAAFAPPPSRRGAHSAPAVTYGLLGVTIAIYLTQMASTALLGYDLPELIGIKANAWIRAGEYWRLVTPIFLHASPAHIFFNMYALFQVGPQVEQVSGRARFLLLYLLSGVAGVVLSYWLSPAMSLGASGSIFGLIGAFAVFLYRHRALLGPVGRNMLINIVVVIGINIAISFTPHIDLWGHFGGLAAGALLMLFAGPRLEIQSDPVTGSPALADSRPFRSAFPFYILTILLLAFLGALPALIAAV